MTRRERLVTLLEWYPDVIEGLRDTDGTHEGEGLQLMCRAWNHPSYRELERVRLVMRDAEPVLYWQLAERYIRCETRRMLQCPKCERYEPVSVGAFSTDGSVQMMHRHGQRSVVLVPRSVKTWSRAVRPAQLDKALAWVDTRFQGEPFLPDELLPMAA